MIRAINTLNKTTLASFIYAGEEVKKARQRVSGKDVKIISVVNNSPKNEYIEAITQRDLEVIPFSQRHEESVINKLAV